MVALLALLVGSLSSPVGVVELPESSTAEVYAYGQRLLPPFVFLEEDEILTLNGYPFVPSGYVAPSAPMDPNAARRSRPALTQGFQAETTALRNRALEAMDAAATKDEALEAARAVYAASPLVKGVRILKTSLVVTYSETPGLPVHLLFDDQLQRFNASDGESKVHSKLPKLTAAQRERSMFDRTIQQNGIYAFGSGYRLYYVGDEAAKLRLLISKSSTAALRDQDVGSPLFFEDVRAPRSLPALRASVGLAREQPEE